MNRHLPPIQSMQNFALIRLLGFETKLANLERQVEIKAYDLPSCHTEQWQNTVAAIMDTWDLYADLIGKTRLQAYPIIVNWLSENDGTNIISLITQLSRNMKEVSHKKNIGDEFQSPSTNSLRISGSYS